MSRRAASVGLVCLLVAGGVLLTRCSGGGSKEETKAPTPSGPPVDPATAATLSGTVIFEGTPPPEQVLNMGTNPDCAALHPQKQVPAGDVIVADGKVANAVVWVKDGLGERSFAPPATPVEVDQQGCLYVPRVVSLQVGQKVKVKNSDALLHNVRGPDFNFSLARKGLQKEVDLDTPKGVVEMRCDVHPWMKGYAWAFPHPFHAVTGPSGTFELKGLPPGTYQIGAWHERFGTKTESVTVGPNEAKTLDLRFAPGASG